MSTQSKEQLGRQAYAGGKIDLARAIIAAVMCALGWVLSGCAARPQSVAEGDAQHNTATALRVQVVEGVPLVNRSYVDGLPLVVSGRWGIAAFTDLAGHSIDHDSLVELLRLMLKRQHQKEHKLQIYLVPGEPESVTIADLHRAIATLHDAAKSSGVELQQVVVNVVIDWESTVNRAE